MLSLAGMFHQREDSGAEPVRSEFTCQLLEVRSLPTGTEVRSSTEGLPLPGTVVRAPPTPTTNCSASGCGGCSQSVTADHRAAGAACTQILQGAPRPPAQHRRTRPFACCPSCSFLIYACAGEKAGWCPSFVETLPIKLHYLGYFLFLVVPVCYILAAS